MMEVQFAPNSIEAPNLLYKIQRKINVFNTTDKLPNRGYNLVTSSSKHGVIFVGCPDGSVSVYYVQQLIDKSCESPMYMPVKTTDKLTHISVSCDQEMLAVIGGSILHVYKVVNFAKQSPAPSVSINLDTNASSFVSSLQWNPCLPTVIAIAYFDGTLLVIQVNTKQIKKIQSLARCVCWSPKGKQLVVGNSDGTLCQYKPDLSLMKTIPAPNLFDGAPVEAIAIHWISTYQFAVVFKNATDNSRPAVTIVNTPKGGQPTCLNYEDICYSMGSSRPWYFYLEGFAYWNLILAASSNSMELATLASDDGNNWTQWCQSDEARPELPLTDKKIENYPVGVCVDTCYYLRLPWGENDILPHMPLLFVISQSGLLTLFNIVNLNKAALPLTVTEPQQLTLPANMLVSTNSGVQETQAQPIENTSFAAAGQKPAAFAASKPPPAYQVEPKAPPPAAIQPTQMQAPSMQTTFFQAPPLQVQPVQQAVPKPAIAPTQTPKPTQQKPLPPSQPNQTTAQTNAIQERANMLKANKELKEMLDKEVNEFEMELYKFKLDISANKINLNGLEELSALTDSLKSHNSEQLRKECSLEDLRNSIIQLKLELVRTCAFVAEARSHSEAKEYQWTQIDPLSSKRLASVKKLAYYVQNQLEQAHKSLDYKWNAMADREQQFSKPGQNMIRPILDDVYQPLVRQQEILGRQQAVLRTLRNTLNECDSSPMFKSTSLLRNTPFRNNKDPLSKLTKNILNMSIDPQNKENDNALAMQKLDALRERLANHKTVKIKPVNLELTEHLATMRLNYEKNAKEKAAMIEKDIQKSLIKAQGPTTIAMPLKEAEQKPSMKISSHTIASIKISKPATEVVTKLNPPKDQLNIKSAEVTFESKQPAATEGLFSLNANAVIKPAPTALNNVARTLFTDEPNKEATNIQLNLPRALPKKHTTVHNTEKEITSLPQTKNSTTSEAPKETTLKSNTPPASDITRSALKDLLQNKSQLNLAPKDPNVFMGLKICSPTSFSATTQSSSAPLAFNAPKPIFQMSDMFNKLQDNQPTFGTQSQLKTAPSSTTETNVSEKQQISMTSDASKNEKPIVFGAKVVSSTSNTQPATVASFEPTKIDGITKLEPTSPVDSKENIEKTNDKGLFKLTDVDKKENTAPKTFGFNLPQSKVTPTFGLATTASITTQEKVESPKETEVVKASDTNSTTPSTFAEASSNTAIEQKVEKPTDVIKPSDTNSASSLFAAATASAATVQKVEKPTDVIKPSDTNSASSLFAAASASAEKKSSSVFGSPPATSQTSIFGSPSKPTTPTSMPSIFASAPATTSDQNAVTQSGSLFGKPASSASSIFASAAAAAPAAQSPVFGTATTSPPVFGTSQPFGSQASKPSIFGSPTSTTSSVFGSTSVTQSSTTTTTQAGFATTVTTQSVFGSQTSQASTLFGSAAGTKPVSIFGAPSVSSSSSVFGAPAPTASVFGAPTATTQPSVFSSPTPAGTTSIFGAPAATQASIFGATPSTQTSVFGTPVATTAQSGGSLFGATESLFASASISATNAPSQSTDSVFGGGSSFQGFGTGSPTNVFGYKPAAASFGQSNTNTNAASIFGGGASNTFQAKPANNFWAAKTTASAFGAPAFGQTTTQASSVFGTGSFSTPSSGAFGSASGQQSTFGTPNNQSGGSVFGTPTQAQQQSPGFGSSAAFGSKAAFGQPSRFGSPAGFGASAFNKSPTSGFGAGATFGGGATFGSTSPGKVFGNSPAPSFATPNQSNATFESLATQNTISFGNLAQQSQQPQAPPSFNTSPSFTGWRG